MTRPRVGFLGVGWIGRNRMEAMLATGAIEAAAVADPSDAARAAALALAPDAAPVDSLAEMLALDLDGVVIATPSAGHAAEARSALERGVAVFCQKPLGRTGAEAAAVVAEAEKADRLLAVDLSYRHTDGMRALKQLVDLGALGAVFAADLTFHNAYGPDKPWFFDPTQSGGGCVVDLGVHLADLALWLLRGEVTGVQAALFAGGARLTDPATQVEDFATATLTLGTGAMVRLACSWHAHAGRNAVIAAKLYGTRGGASFRNVGGSFYDFEADHFTGTSAHPLTREGEGWGGRAAADWARRLANGEGFDPEAHQLVTLAGVLDRIYGRA
jgi:predicted dehydrogenase